MSKGNVLRLVIGVICLVLAVVIGAIVFREYYKRESADRAMKDLVPATTEDMRPTPKPEPLPDEPEEADDEPIAHVPSKDINWDELHEVNSDIYAWVFVPGTAIDYPVLQHPTDDYFYLNHNMDGSTGYPGCIYTEGSYNKKDFTDPVTVLYGHNMKNGSMFKGLHDFENEEFFNRDNYIYIYTKDGNYAYEVVSALEIDDRHLLAGWNFEAENFMEVYEGELKSIGRGGFKDAEITEDDKLIILSTCANGGRDEIRYTVQGKYIGKAE